MTGRDLVSASLRLIGVQASGQTPTSQEATDGLASLNRMIDSWSNEKLLIYAISAETPLTLVAGTAAYTLGTGGNITSRPQEIMGAMIRDGTIDYSVDVITFDEYLAIPNKSDRSTYPQKLYDDGGYPQRTITLWPVPSAGKSLVLYTKRVLTTIATLDTVVSLPPGYERALVSNGAIEIAPEYGKAVPDSLAMMASESKASIKRANHRTALLRCDPALVGRGHFNINTGDYSR